MKTVLRIGLILISVIAVWVACFAQSGTQPASQSSPNTPQPVSGTSAREDVVTKVIALRDSFLNEIRNNGFNPDPPRIVMDNPLVIGNYESEKNVLHISRWEALSPEQKAIFSQLVVRLAVEEEK